MNFNRLFSNIASTLARLVGHPIAFVLALVVTVVWGISGPFFGFSDSWQLVMNTVTNIITFLIVFLIQNIQNRDGAATQIKLDELIRAHKGAHDALLDLENFTNEELIEVKKKYETLAKRAKIALHKGMNDKGTEDV